MEGGGGSAGKGLLEAAPRKKREETEREREIEVGG